MASAHRTLVDLFSPDTNVGGTRKPALGGSFEAAAAHVTGSDASYAMH
jgi:hypothetical protein